MAVAPLLSESKDSLASEHQRNRHTAGLGNRRSRRSSRTAWAALRLRGERRGQGRQQRRKREGRKEEGRSIDTNLGPRLTETAGAGAGAGTHISLRPFTENSP